MNKIILPIVFASSLVATQAVAETPKMSISDIEVVATQDSMPSSTGIIIPLMLLVLVAVAVASDSGYPN